jgi:hypothetical protein
VVVDTSLIIGASLKICMVVGFAMIGASLMAMFLLARNRSERGRANGQAQELRNGCEDTDHVAGGRWPDRHGRALSRGDGKEGG